jgi:PAS domain S-box-containing protein
VQGIQSKEELIQNLESMAKTLVAFPISLVLTNVNAEIIWVNGYFCKKTGFAAAEAIGQNPRILKSGFQPKSFYERFWETLCAGNSWQGEFCNRTKEGDTYWEKASITKIVLEGSDECYYFALKEDITDQKSLEQENWELREREGIKIKQLELLYWLARNGVDSSRSMNEFLQDSLQALRQFFSGMDLVIFLRWKEYKYGNPLERHYILIYKETTEIDGHVLQLQVGSRFMLEQDRFYLDDKLLNAFFGEWVHVLQLRAMEESLKMQKEQIFQASKMLSLGELTTGMAHEINNPANYILLNSEILQNLVQEWQELCEQCPEASTMLSNRGRHPEEILQEQLQFIKGIEEGTLRIRDIINRLREFAKQQDAPHNAVNVMDVVQSVQVILGKAILKETDHFQVNIPKELPMVWGNKHQIEQVLLNLISNSCKAITAKSQAIIISAVELPEDGVVRISVRDEGVGIAKETLMQVTDPFYTTRRSQGGIGLGLSISERIIQAHGSFLHIESKEGRGTTVHFSLPVAQKAGGAVG